MSLAHKSCSLLPHPRLAVWNRCHDQRTRDAGVSEGPGPLPRTRYQAARRLNRPNASPYREPLSVAPTAKNSCRSLPLRPCSSLVCPQVASSLKTCGRRPACLKLVPVSLTGLRRDVGRSTTSPSPLARPPGLSGCGSADHISPEPPLHILPCLRLPGLASGCGSVDPISTEPV